MTKLPILVERITSEGLVNRTEADERFHRGFDDKAYYPACSQGCNHCCYHPIKISVIEGVLLYKHLQDKGAWTSALRKDCLSKSKLTVGLAVETWLMAALPCPLLKDGSCLGYSARPFVCRTTYAAGDPDACHPHKFGPNTKVIPRAEALDAYLRVEKAMFKQLDMRYRMVPVSLALLLGERICAGDLDFQDSEDAIVQEYLEAIL